MNTDELNSATALVRRAFRTGRFFAFLLVVGVLCGCAHRYDMLLTNGEHLTNIRKPTLNKEGGYYSYVSATGKTVAISASRVVEIDPH